MRPELILHHTYARGAAVDVSGNANHGHITRAPPGPSRDTLTFAASSSRVRVPPSTTLRRFGSLRARTRFRLDPAASPERRYNLMEGYLSFALYVVPDLGLKGTMFDANRHWQGAVSAPGAVQPGRWHTAELTYVDSAARVDIALDGVRLASQRGVAGPVRPVGELGVAIGTWPDDDRYTLQGALDEAQLWRTQPEFDDFFDPCCADLGALDRLVDRLRRDPAVTSGEVDPTEIIRGLQMISARARAEVVGDDPARAEQVQRLQREFEAAYARQDLRGMLQTCARGYQLLLQAGVSSSWAVEQGKEGLELLRRTQLGRDLLDPIIALGSSRSGSGSTSAGLTHKRRDLPDPPRQTWQLVADAVRALCLPSPQPPDQDGAPDDGEPESESNKAPRPSRGDDEDRRGRRDKPSGSEHDRPPGRGDYGSDGAPAGKAGKRHKQDQTSSGGDQGDRNGRKDRSTPEGDESACRDVDRQNPRRAKGSDEEDTP